MVDLKSTFPKVSARLNSRVVTSSADASEEQDTRKGVQSVEHAFSLLEIFQQADKPLAIKDVAEISGMPASKVHHYLVSLVRCGVIQRTAEGNYDLGPFALHLGLSALSRIEPLELAATAVKKLCDQSGEATFISVWGNLGPTIIRYFEGRQPVAVEARAGHVLPLATSATGRVFLNWGSEFLTDRVLAREKVKTSAVKKMKADTERAGVGRAERELLPRIAALAAPVFDMDDRLVLVITQLGWAGEFDSSLKGQTCLALVQTSQQLSADLGYNPR